MSVGKQRQYKGGASTKPKRAYADRNGSLMTDDEVADELAVTSRMVRRLIERGELRGMKVGKLVRVHREDLVAYIAQQRGEAK